MILITLEMASRAMTKHPASKELNGGLQKKPSTCSRKKVWKEKNSLKSVYLETHLLMVRWRADVLCCQGVGFDSILCGPWDSCWVLGSLWKLVPACSSHIGPRISAVHLTVPLCLGLSNYYVQVLFLFWFPFKLQAMSHACCQMLDCVGIKMRFSNTFKEHWWTVVKNQPCNMFNQKFGPIERLYL